MRACPATTSSACPTPCAGSRAIGSGRPFAGCELVWPNRNASPSTWPRPGEQESGAGLDLAIAVGVLVATEQLPPEAVAGSGSSASSASTARCAGYRAWRRWSTCSATSTSSCRFPMRSRRGSRHGARLGLRPTCARWSMCLPGEQPWPTRSRGFAARRPTGWSRPRRRPRTTGCPARARDRRRRRAPPAVRRLAGHVARRCLPSAWPDSCRRSTETQALETTMVHSAAGLPLPRGGLIHEPSVPGAAPHDVGHRDLAAAAPRSSNRASCRSRHNGVLFIDELGEFARPALEGLREPLEEGVIRVARAVGRARPAGPVPARRGHEPVSVRWWSTGVVSVRRQRPARYLRRLSGPLPTGSTCAWWSIGPPSTSCSVPSQGSRQRTSRQRVVAAPRRIALRRVGKLNAALSPDELDEVRASGSRRPPGLARRDRARSADRPRLPPCAAGGSHDRRPHRARPGARHGRPHRVGAVDAGLAAGSGDDDARWIA